MGILDSLIGAGTTLFGIKKQEKTNQANMDMQREFAQQGIRWRVEDAKAAGIHPLAAMGANTTPYQPIYQDSVVDDYRALGQDISRAVHSTRTAKERAEKLAELSVEREELQNELLQAQISNLSRVGPPIPAIGDDNVNDGNGSRVSVTPVEQQATEKGMMGKEAGAHASYTYEQLADGAVGIRPTEGAKQKMEDDFFLETAWKINNLFLPSSKGGPAKPPKKYWPKGAVDMRWSFSRSAFVPVYPKKHYPKGFDKNKALRGNTHGKKYDHPLSREYK